MSRASAKSGHALRYVCIKDYDDHPSSNLVSMELGAWHYYNHAATAPITTAFNASSTICMQCFEHLPSPTVPGLDAGSYWGCRFRQC